MSDARVLHGVGVSPGIAVGPAVVLQWDLPDVPHRVVPEQNVEAEVHRLHEAMAAVQRYLQELRERAEERIGPEEAKIFDAQLMMLQDQEFLGGVERLIRENQLTAERAFEFKALEVRALWANSANSLLRQRTADLSGVQIRVLQQLLGHTDGELLDASDGRPAIVFTQELAPGLTVQFEREHVIGFASAEGTRTSHGAILARSLGIPCVMGLVGGLERVRNGMEVILDGTNGTVVVDPTPEEIEHARQQEVRRQALHHELEQEVGRPAETKDGVAVTLRGNLDLPEELDQIAQHGAAGVGLLRTEFLMVGRTSLPDEDEQYRYFRRVAERFSGYPVVIRSFDVGGDKFPAAFRIVPEPNPFLGWRALRVCLDHPEIFMTQIRALLRARMHGDVQLMLPLVIELDEVAHTRQLVAEAAGQLQQEGVPAAQDLPVGVMVETPAAVEVLDQLLDASDFVSIGTNDLTQYTLAVDRGNARLARRFTPFHPGVVRMLKRVIDAGREARIPVSVCGELASEPLGAFLLIGLGCTTLSVSPSALPLIRWLVRRITKEGAQLAAAEALQGTGASRIVRVLERHVAEHVDLRLLDAGRLPRLSGKTSLK
ncbi:MAG TPA: phosphoenolpyruvate--protein phosphotransferase [Gemmatimonadales bacterium]|nr:phosphoenolpyruvate--protein phosphotransferase [Gemmatimonadales bacterium]